METIEDIGCKFRVYRTSKKPKVISISLWKANQAYIFNLSRSILWWGANGKFLFPDWNIRFYIDYSIFRKKFREDVDWREIIDSVKRHDNIEIWFYECSWGKDPDKQGHINTFGSLVRFHAFLDKEVEVALCKNIELLSTPKDSRLIHDWVNSGKKFYVIYNPAYECNYGDLKMCAELGYTDKPMILATFGVSGGLPKELFNELNILMTLSPKLNKYPYGVDEILLTSFIKPILTLENTYIVLRALSNQIWPLESENKNYIPVYNIIREWFAEQELDMPNFPNAVQVEIGRLSTENPNKLVEMFKDIEKKLNPNNPELLNKYFKGMEKFYFALFERNIVVPDSEDYLLFFYQAETPQEAKLLAYLSIKTVIFEDIDWIGYSIKKKKGVEIEPKEPEITEPVIEEQIKRIERSDKINRRETKNKKDKAIREILHAYNMEKKLYEKNKKIFRDNLKNILLFSDTEYY